MGRNQTTEAICRNYQGIHQMRLCDSFESFVSFVVQSPSFTPDDVAGVVLYLVSDLATFVTGDTAEVNGGAWFA